MKAKLPFPNADRVPVKDLTLQACYEMSAFFYEKYFWDTNDIEDLWLAGMAKYVAMEGEKRYPARHKANLVLIRIEDCAKRGRPFSYIDEDIHGMVAHYTEEALGRAILGTIVRQTGLWHSANEPEDEDDTG